MQRAARYDAPDMRGARNASVRAVTKCVMRGGAAVE